MSDPSFAQNFVPITEGPFAGWFRWGGVHDPFENRVGAFVFRFRPSDGAVECGIMPLPEHCNGSNTYLHGGFLLTFADYSLFALAHRELASEPIVTMNLHADFVGAAVPNIPLISSGEVIRATRSMVFVRGQMSQADKPVLAFSGILKRIGK